MAHSASSGTSGRAPRAATALRRLLAEECNDPAVHALEPYSGILTNLAEVALQTPAGETSLRNFLRFVGTLHAHLAESRAAYDAVGQHCEELRRYLHIEHEGRLSDGFRMAVGAMGYDQALERERQARSHLEAQLHSMGSRLAYSTGQQQRQALEFRTLMRSMAEAEVEMEERLRAEVQRQGDLVRSSHSHAVKQLHAEHGQRSTEAQRAEAGLRAELEKERAASEVLREEAETLDKALEPLRQLHAARIPCVLDMISFMHQTGPELLRSALPCRARVPILALEWPPNTELETLPCWQHITGTGVFRMLHELCIGELLPEDMDMTVTACCVDGRWIGGLHGHEEAPRLAALLMFQALRLDTTVTANCRIVPMKRPLLPKGVLELDPKRRSAAPVGPGRVRTDAPAGVLWNVRERPHPDPVPAEESDEAQLRHILKGCPMEKDLLSALCYVRAAMPEALSRGPAPLMASPAQVAVR